LVFSVYTEFGSDHSFKTKVRCGMARKVLVVDDNEVNRLLLGQVLSLVFGWDVIGAESGEMALVELMENPQVDVVFMDVQMPGIGGEVAAQEVLRLYPHTHLFFCTARLRYRPPGDLANDVRVHVLEKPIDVATVTAAVATIVGY
jgi:CheY-like chemotaxis protein